MSSLITDLQRTEREKKQALEHVNKLRREALKTYNQLERVQKEQEERLSMVYKRTTTTSSSYEGGGGAAAEEKQVTIKSSGRTQTTKEKKKKQKKPSYPTLQVVTSMTFVDYFGDRGTYTGQVNHDKVPHGIGQVTYDHGLVQGGKWMNGMFDETDNFNASRRTIRTSSSSATSSTTPRIRRSKSRDP